MEVIEFFCIKVEPVKTKYVWGEEFEEVEIVNLLENKKNG